MRKLFQAALVTLMLVSSLVFDKLCWYSVICRAA
jgi:hypothetical protein